MFKIPLASRTTGFQCVMTFDLSKTDTAPLEKSPKFDQKMGAYSS